MSDIRELYQQLILDHSQHPRNFKILEAATHQHEGYNPLCGDQITIYLREQEGIITETSFYGKGCAISTASASLLSDAIKGLSIPEVLELMEAFQQLITGKLSLEQITEDQTHIASRLQKLTVLAGVTEFPMRVKCATLAWHTLRAALK